MNIAKAIDFIKEFEGYRSHPYQDSGGVWSIGYGTVSGITEDSPPVTEASATLLLEHDLRFAVNAIQRLVPYPLNDNQFAALCSFIYNVGVHAFETSTMLKLLKNAQYDLASAQFLRWNHIGGEKSGGLTTRRKSEQELFLKPVTA